MAKFRIDKIGELCRQMAFTPLEARAAQVSAAEELLLEVDPAKAFPLDYIIYRITGYHPKLAEQPLLTGLALQHDLGLLIEQVSQTLGLRATMCAEPVLMIDDVTERFNVTSKTIQRWRRKGLPARRFIFTDGKSRVGFLLSTVERFLATHSDQVNRSANLSLVADDEKSVILRHADRLARVSRCSAPEIARRIARKLNRSPLTITHIIRRHDQENPQAAIFAAAPQPISIEDRAQIVRSHRRGASLSSLARRNERSRADIYRAIIEDRLARLFRRKVKFIDDPLYHQDDAAAVVREIVSQQDLMASADPARVPRDLPPYLADLYRTPLLSPARERALFLELNYHKFTFVTARRRIEPQFARGRDLNLLEACRRRVVETKNQLVRANLRLVVSVARKHLRPGLSLMELISDGNLTLMRAVDSFDFHKGYRFSTYANLALMKGFARSVPQMQATGKKATGCQEALASVPDRAHTPANDQWLNRDEVNQLLSRLEPREREVLRAHYGLHESTPATYEQVGSKLGLSKQRVRQIEQAAIAKLRATGLGN